MKKFIILVFITSFLLILIGVFLNFKKTESHKSIEKEQQINTSEFLKKEHCLGTLCIQSMEITYQSKLGIISFILINKGNDALPAGFIKLEFEHNQEFTYISYHPEILPNETQKTEIEVLKNNIIQMKDYEIKELTASELAEIGK